ncbi:DUF6279 family lipoprotein [Xylophilus sp. GW821-FHT01B05]
MRIIGVAAGALLATALLQACSTMRLAYDQSPQLAYWWLDGYVDFDSNQSRQVREDLDALQQWHRSSELPQIDALLRQAQDAAPREITADSACRLLDGVRERLQAVTLRAEDVVAVSALSLQPEQIDNIRRKFERNNAKYRKLWLDATPEDWRARRLKEVRERSEMLYGRLSPAQREALQEHIARSAFDPQRRYAEMLLRQQDLLQTLAQLSQDKPPPEQARATVRALFERALNPPDADQRRHQQALQREGCEAFAQVHALATPAQRQTAVERLQDYRRDLRRLEAAR